MLALVLRCDMLYDDMRHPILFHKRIQNAVIGLRRYLFVRE